LNWTGPGIEPGWYLNDFRFCLPDVQPPYTSGWAVTQNPNYPSTSTNKYIIGTGSYYVNGDLNLGNNETLYVSGNATLYVTGNIRMQSQNSSSITLAVGASLEIFVGTTSGPATDVTLTMINNSGQDDLFQIYGLPSLKTMSWNGNASFSGVVYAPEASLTLGGGSSSTYDFQGACTVQATNLNRSFNFHYDENLKRFGPTR